MQALYQLSYSPWDARRECLVARTGSVSSATPVYRTPLRHNEPWATTDPKVISAVVAQHGLGKGPRVVLEHPPSGPAHANQRPRAVCQRPERSPELLGHAE